MPSFYANNTFYNVVYATDIAIENHFSNLLLEGETDRIIYSSNAYAFRKRSDQNSGNLNLPFMNYYLRNYEPGKRIWWNSPAYTQGVYIDTLQTKIMYTPILLSYEVSYWCNRDDELKYITTEVNFDADNKTVLNPQIEIESETVPLTALLSYTGNDYDTEYNEKDWLERNNIHNASLNITLDTFAVKTNSDICIPTQALFEFYAYHTNDENEEEKSLDELYTFLINHLTETVTEVT